MPYKVVAFVLSFAIAASSPTRAQGEFQLGVGVHPSHSVADTARALDMAGAGFRSDMPWSLLETQKGILSYPLNHPTLKFIEALVDDAQAHGKRPILILGYGNKFYDGGGQISSSEGIAAFAKYAGFVVNHFKGRVDQFEVWNEWFNGSGASPTEVTRGDPKQYAALLGPTYAAIKAANPNAVVLTGSVGLGKSEMAWVTDWVAAGGLRFTDGFSVHPYVHCNATSTPAVPVYSAAFPNSAAYSHQVQDVGAGAPGGPEQSISGLDSLHDYLSKALPEQTIPIYVTEIGWPTSVGQCGVPQAVAAAYLQRFMVLAYSRPYIAGVWWYDLFNDGISISDREQTFGLLAASGDKKPAYDALTAIAATLDGQRRVMAVTKVAGLYVASGRTPTGRGYTAAWLPTDDFSAAAVWNQARQLLQTGAKPAGNQQIGGDLGVGAVPVVLEQ